MPLPLFQQTKRLKKRRDGKDGVADVKEGAGLWRGFPVWRKTIVHEWSAQMGTGGWSAKDSGRHRNEAERAVDGAETLRDGR